MKRLIPLVICCLISRRRQTIDYVISQILELFRQNFCIPEHLKHLRTLENEHRKSLYAPSVPIAFSLMHKPLSPVLPKRVYPVSMRMPSKSTQRKLARYKKTSSGKVLTRSFVTNVKKDNLEAKKKCPVVRKRIATNNCHYTSRH